jgi:hypothetical protein
MHVLPLFFVLLFLELNLCFSLYKPAEWTCQIDPPLWTRQIDPPLLACQIDPPLWTCQIDPPLRARHFQPATFSPPE